MHVQDEIIVNDELIEYAESIVLPNGMHFNQERIDYLRDLTTLDLKAVPGSGKTTLLLAKLVILEKNLPLKSGKAILVLSHTNAAVDEISYRIKDICPKLFAYPNFVGTIQSFVNKFLAIPYFESKKGNGLQFIDSVKYDKWIEKNYNYIDYKARKWVNSKFANDPVRFVKSIRLNENNELIEYIGGTVEDFKLKDKKSNTYKELKKFKNYALEKGFLHYDDAYYLANRYIINCPVVVDIIKERFGLVFVDEMQDMDKHQYKILELFNHDSVCFQRLGDNNQAIYNNIIHSENLWTTRDNVRTIKGSYRLTERNAHFVSRLALDDIHIESLRNHGEGFKPILVVFDDDKHECKVIQTFSKYINSLLGDRCNLQKGYKVIAWRKEHLDNKLSLKEYCPKYLMLMKDKLRAKELRSTNYEIVKHIYDKMGDFCYNEQIEVSEELVSKSNIKKLASKDNKQQEIINLQIYNLVLDCLNKNNQKFKLDFNELLRCVLDILGISENESDKIINGIDYDFEFIDETLAEISGNCLECGIGEVLPVIGTVHSVKGETHDITLFLESFYKKKYESHVLSEVLTGEETVKTLIMKEKFEIDDLEKEIKTLESRGEDRGVKTKKEKIKKHRTNIKNIEQYSKLVYVALSRATKVVGYGVSKTNYDKFMKNKISTDEWDIIYCE